MKSTSSSSNKEKNPITVLKRKKMFGSVDFSAFPNIQILENITFGSFDNEKKISNPNPSQFPAVYIIQEGSPYPVQVSYNPYHEKVTF